MIRLTFTVDNINTVIQVYNQIQVQRSATETGTYETIVGVGPVILSGGTSSYTLDDATGISTDWYISRYYSTGTGYFSEWSSPVLGEAGDIFYNPLYPEEVSYGTAQQLTINRIRRLIGDPIRLRREYGGEAISSVHMDSKTFELPVTGWPASVIMGGTNFNSLNNPSVNDYRYLRFNDYIGDICEECVTYSGCAEDIEKTIPFGIDIWYYTFRHSDKQIMDAYDNCPPPPPLTTNTANAEAYMLQTAIDLLRQELWEDSVEDGAAIRDDVTNYNPEPGMKIRKQLLDDLEKKLDKLIKVVMMSGVTGVLID
jgi:hypothetical protein